ncbi:DUF1048 domain-containing protein [Agromyces marinus]|uniref:DNA-binding ferritin-like protein (Dps family) n=1 Tax=Agromyces marinus TaxID=1389020 RepID=A0ABM8GZZ1_9MICO|nr:DUF1048 domain-containing protein [Agromyces marinus]UIP57753.1 hypothetical protein DSM26151_06190 [Agromyces marinus]BDZ54072.1 hypothetical protein GCM10025870_11450 [Agromyces marinus]
MAAKWIETITGSLDDKKQYKQYKARLEALPGAHRTAAQALDRYVLYAGGITKSDVMLTMLDDLATLFEQAAADGTPVRAIVGEDPVAFAEEFLANYVDGQWITKEKQRLTDAIERAEADES